MKAEILCVGTELLLGDIVNTNAQFLSRELASLGINVYYQSVVGDNKERVKEALEVAFNRADIVITTGGLGPTKDDLTKEIVSEYFNKELILDEKALDNISMIMKKLGALEVSQSNKKQALMPKGSIILHNDFGTAPGCVIEDGKKSAILLPGPPKEVEPMFKKAKELYLNKKCEKILVSKNISVFGIGESDAADMVGSLLDSENPTVAPYAKENNVLFRVTASARDIEKAKEQIEEIAKKMRKIFGENIFSEEDKAMEEVVVNLLKEKNLTIATAESCTGGLLAGTMINVAGISDNFIQGVITYNNESKISTLGIKKETIENYGAVSEETAKEMAQAIAKISGSDIGISTTGIAGPTGGSKEKPVGLVYIGLYYRGNIKVKKINVPGDRQKVRQRSVYWALDMARRAISTTR